MNQDSYLERIGLRGTRQPTLETLIELQHAHLEHVPFENLDIHLGRPIWLNQRSFFEKIVHHRRGGFCYELNGLFAWLLEDLGYQVTLLSASDSKSDGSWGPEFDHLALQIVIPGEPGEWLADVGWGDTFREPLRLDRVGEQAQSGRAYWFVREADEYHLFQREVDGSQERQYRFTLQPRRLEEFAGMCAYHQESPDSPFTRERLVTLATPAGRVTLSSLRLIETIHNVRGERLLSGEEEYQQMLFDRFGIVIGEWRENGNHREIS